MLPLPNVWGKLIALNTELTASVDLEKQKVK
jgi:hypothetical protein